MEKTKKEYEDLVRTGLLAASRAVKVCAPAIRALTPVLSDAVPTMGTDKYYRVYVNPAFLDQCEKLASEVSEQNPCRSCGETNHHNIAYVGGTLCHEAWHPLREHHDRAKNMDTVNDQQRNAWACATDMEINDDLIEIFQHTNNPRLCIPPIQAKQDPGILIPKIYKLKNGLLCEDYYYKILEKNDQEGDGGNQPQCDCGSGQDGEERSYEEGEPGAGKAPGISQIEGRMIRKNVANKIKEAAKNRGNIPGGWQRWCDEVLQPPKYDWRDEMNKVVNFALNSIPGDRLRSYRRLGRRTASLGNKAILPSHFNPIPEVTIVQDTSGSMDDGAIATARSESEGILKGAGARINYIAVDMHADTVQQINGSIQSAELHGGGGTDMRVGIEAAMKAYPRPDIIFLFTDGWTPWPEEPLEGGVQLVIGLVGEHACSTCETPTWAHTVKITGDDVEVRGSYDD